MPDFAARLAQRREQGLYRERRTLQSPQGPDIVVDGRPMLAFCSNDYLGLANHPELVARWREAVLETGVGGGASHLVCGHHEAHHALEQALARHTGRDAALLFSTGYMANLGVISALAGRGDTVVEDRWNHASLLDGGVLSRARLVRYAHADPAAARARLLAATGERLLVTDGVFSMDGDIAPLPALAQVCRATEATLIVDDAHGLGVLGPHGEGSVVAAGLTQADVPVLIGTLGKALGTSGAFVAGSAELIDYLVQMARTYIYTTAMPPALSWVTCRSLELAREEGWRRERLHRLIRAFREGMQALGYALMPSDTPIQPILVGGAEQALAMSRALEAQGILVTAIRPPTVPEGSSRLRVTLSAAHTDAHLERLLQAFAALPAVWRTGEQDT